MEIKVSCMDHPALVDYRDFRRVSKCRWRSTVSGHPMTRDWSPRRPGYGETGKWRPVRHTRRAVSMGRYILRLGPGYRIKFVNGKAFDCRRRNMLVWKVGHPPVRPECIRELGEAK